MTDSEQFSIVSEAVQLPLLPLLPLPRLHRLTVIRSQWLTVPRFKTFHLWP